MSIPDPVADADGFCALALRHLCGDLAADEAVAFTACLASSPEARRLLALTARMDAALQESCAADASERRLEQRSGVMQRALFQRRIARWAAWGVAAVLAAAVVVLWPARTHPAAPRVVAATGATDWTVGRQVLPDTPFRLAADAAVTLAYADGTELTLTAATGRIATGSGAKTIHLDQGHVAASVAAQPAGRPLRLRTARSVVEVLGTRLHLVAGPRQDLVVTTAGLVRLVRRADGATAQVGAGAWLTTDATGGPLQVRPCMVGDEARLVEEVLAGGRPQAPAPDAARLFAEDMAMPSALRPAGPVTGVGGWITPRSGPPSAPAGWGAAGVWGRICAAAPANPARNVRVEIRDLRLWCLERDGAWRQLGADPGCDGRDDPVRPARSVDLRRLADGTSSLGLPEVDGHIVIWPAARAPVRSVIRPAAVTGMAAAFWARLVPADAAQPDDLDIAGILAVCGGSFYPDTRQALKADFSNSAEWAVGRFKRLGRDWQAVTACSVDPAVLARHPPPLLIP